MSTWDVVAVSSLERRRLRKQARRESFRNFVISLRQRGLVLLPVLCTFFAILSFGGVYGWAYGSAYIALFAGVIVWAARYINGKVKFRPRAVYIPMLLLAGLVFWQYFAGATVTPAATLSMLLHLAGCAALFFLVTQTYRGERDASWILPMLSIFTAAISALAILQFFSGLGKIYWVFRYSYANPMGTYVNRDHYAGCMELLLPVCVAQALAQRDRSPWKLFWWSLFPAVSFASLLLSASRGGMVSAMVELLLGLWVLWAAERRRKKRARERGRAGVKYQGFPAYWTAALTIGVVMLAYGAVVGVSRLERRFADLRQGYVAAATRIQLNETSLKMFRVHPVTGWGAGTWNLVYPRYAPYDDFRGYEFAHDDYLQWLCETGLLGSACALLFLGLWIAAIAAAQRQRMSWEARALSLAAAIACAGVLVHSFVDMNLHIPANLLLFYFMAAVAIGLGEERQRQRNASDRQPRQTA